MLMFFFTNLSFLLFMVICFFLLIRFLIVKDYELPKSTSFHPHQSLFSTFIVSLIML